MLHKCIIYIQLVWWQTTEWQCAIVFDVMSTLFRNIVHLFTNIKMVSKRQQSTRISNITTVFVHCFSNHVCYTSKSYCIIVLYYDKSCPNFMVYQILYIYILVLWTIHSVVHVNAVFNLEYMIPISKTMNNLYVKCTNAEYFRDKIHGNCIISMKWPLENNNFRIISFHLRKCYTLLNEFV